MSSRRKTAGFTLVELLVVIGIIAALIGILLPVLSGVQSRGRDIKCQSNLRQIVQGIFNYATDHKGCMPWGFVWNRSNNPPAVPFPGDWDQAGDNVNHEYISWAGLIGSQMTRKGSGIDDDFSTGLALNFPPVFRCPEAEQSYPHVVGYVMNFIVAVSPWYELVVGPPPGAQLRPPNITLMLKDTVLVWDTAIQGDWEQITGYLTGADIDGQRFWSGVDSPQFRYFSSGDVFGHIPPGTFGNNKPVRLDVGGVVFRNIDPAVTPSPQWPYQGNLRFRHNKGTTCNAGWADGHVEAFVAKLDRNDKQKIQSHNALRHYFMIKWPSGVGPNQSQPF